MSNALVSAFENSHSLPEPEAEYSAVNFSAGGLSAPSSGTPTPLLYCAPDRMTEFSRISRSGMTFKPLTEDLGAAVLTWFLEGFPAKTSAQPEPVQELTALAPACGNTWPGSLARYDRNTHSWKTPQCSFLADLDEFSETWPRWGMMRGGVCLVRERPGRRTSANESGYWLPTPTAHNAKEGNYPAERNRNTPTLAAVLGGKINPEFTEWMMGWPIGWTDCAASGMGKFREWLPSHGIPCRDNDFSESSRLHSATMRTP